MVLRRQSWLLLAATIALFAAVSCSSEPQCVTQAVIDDIRSGNDLRRYEGELELSLLDEECIRSLYISDDPLLRASAIGSYRFREVPYAEMSALLLSAVGDSSRTVRRSAMRLIYAKYPVEGKSLLEHLRDKDPDDRIRKQADDLINRLAASP